MAATKRRLPCPFPLTLQTALTDRVQQKWLWRPRPRAGRAGSRPLPNRSTFSRVSGLLLFHVRWLQSFRGVEQLYLSHSWLPKVRRSRRTQRRVPTMLVPTQGGAWADPKFPSLTEPVPRLARLTELRPAAAGASRTSLTVCGAYPVLSSVAASVTMLVCIGPAP